MAYRNLLMQTIQDLIGDPESGAEIGVYNGKTSKKFLRNWPELKLVLVDPWKEWTEDDSYYRKHSYLGKRDQSVWDRVYQETLKNVEGFPNVQILKMISQEAVERIEDHSLDFVFVDANHTYDAVKQDIKLWLPKCKKLICGHDYGRNRSGVTKAVDEKFDRALTPGGSLWFVTLEYGNA